MLSCDGFSDDASNSSSATSQQMNNYTVALRIVQHNEAKFLTNLSDLEASNKHSRSRTSNATRQYAGDY